MDATRIRPLIESALEAQRVYDAAELARNEAGKALEAAREKLRVAAGNLRGVISDGFVIFGDKVVRIRQDDLCVASYPLATIPVAAPPPPPLPEAPAAPPKLSGGKIPAPAPAKK